MSNGNRSLARKSALSLKKSEKMNQLLDFIVIRTPLWLYDTDYAFSSVEESEKIEL